MRSLVQPWLLLSCGLAWFGCASQGEPPLRITAPEDGAYLGTNDVSVTGEVDLPDVTHVTVAGQEVPVTDGTFRAEVHLEDGTHTLAATAEDLEAIVEVHVDTVTPELEVLSPERAAFIESNTVEITGRVREEHLASLTLDGARITVDDDGRFTYVDHTTEGAYRRRLQAVDRAGNKTHTFLTAVVGTFAAPREPVSSGLALRVGRETLDTLEGAASEALDQTNFAALAARSNPVASGSWGSLYITGETHRQAGIEIIPFSGGIATAVELWDLRVTFDVDSPFGDLDGDVRIEHATLNVDAYGQTEGGRFVVTLGTPHLVMHNFRVDLDGISDFLEDVAGLDRAVEDEVRAIVIGTVEETLPGIIDTVLTSLAKPHSGLVGGQVIGFEMEPAKLDVSDTVMAFDANVATYAINPIPERTRGRGYLVTRRATSLDTRTENMRVGVALDVLNAGLYALWLAGSMDIRWDTFFDGSPLRYQHIALLVPGLREEAREDAPAALVLEPRLPPVATSSGGRLRGSWPDLEVAVVVQEGSGVEREVARISMAGSAFLDLVHMDDGLEWEIRSPETQADPLYPPGVLETGARLDELLGNVMVEMAEMVASIWGVPLPSLDGFTFEPSSIGVRGGFLVIDGRFEPVP